MADVRATIAAVTRRQFEYTRQVHLKHVKVRTNVR